MPRPALLRRVLLPTALAVAPLVAQAPVTATSVYSPDISSCPGDRGISPHSRVYFRTEAEARRAGFARSDAAGYC